MHHSRKLHKPISEKRSFARSYWVPVIAIAAIFIAGCGSSDDSAEPADTTVAPTTSATAPPAEPPSGTAATEPPSTTTTTAPPTTTTTAPPTTTEPPSTTTTTEPPAPTPNYDIATGVNHSCALNAGKVLCWGSNLHGQLGNGESGSTAHSSTPVEVEDISDAVALGAGWEHTCAVHATGEVSCWGDDSQGELGNGVRVNSVALPAKVVGLDNAIDVSAGHWHTCALRSTGAVSCWGLNKDGQLGNDDMGVDSAVPVSVKDISDAVKVSANGEHACAVHATGEVSCWGDNWQGELGNGQAGSESSVPVKVVGLDNAIDVSAGHWHTCALRSTGAVSCWGNNELGQIGNGETYIEKILDDSFVAEPTEVDSLDDAVAITSGSHFSCAVRETGQIACWGSNSDGQLGNGEVDSSNLSPDLVSGIDDAIGVSAGRTHTCAVREGGSVSCFGWNLYGQLGNGQDDVFTPAQVKVAGIDDAVGISSSYDHSCVLHESGEVSCWGRNWKGADADDATGDSPPVPIKVASIDDATQMSAGTQVSCAVRGNSEITCWGSLIGNEFVETEDGEIAPVPLPSPLQAQLGVENITKISSEGSHVCGLEENGRVTCAGFNVFGQLGNGKFSRTPDFSFAQVLDLDDAVDVSLGVFHSCAVHESGEVSCWGRNHWGQLGNGEQHFQSNSAVPQQVVGITDAVAVVAGTFTITCALHENGEVSCWGQSNLGELGTNADPSSDHSAVPVRIEGVSDAVAIAAGVAHVCALHESGEVSCWGGNDLGQLGTDEAVAENYSAVPVKTAGISDATAISAGADHTCALHPTGEVTCWGSDVYGQLGSGDPLIDPLSATPVQVILER